jgi:outer membrane receptor protein involved in Fe transport
MLWPDNATDGLTNYPTLSFPSEAKHSPNDNTSTKNLTVYCDWHLDTEGRLISLTYNNYKKSDNAKSSVWYINPIINLKAWNEYINDADYHIQSGRLDLSLPFGFVTIDAGASYTNINNQGDLQYSKQSDLAMFGNERFYYQEKRKDAYVSLHRDWQRFSIITGLRYEYIGLDREINLHSDKLFNRDFWLPSFSFSFKPKEGQQIALAWGTDCIHPNFYDLNNLRIYKTGYEFFQGDPGLLPSRTSNIELSYHNHKGFYACAYHHHASNVVVRNTQLVSWIIEEEYEL